MMHKKTMIVLSVYAVVAGILVSAYAFFILHIQNKEERTADIIAKVADLEGQNSQLSDLKEILGKIEDKKEILNNVFIDSKNIVNFLESLEEMGRISGASVQVENINESETENELFQTLALDLSILGDWDDVYHFFALLENFPARIAVDRVQIGLTDDKSGRVWEGTAHVTALERLERKKEQ